MNRGDKKYALFAGKCYYAEGGASDFVEWFDDIDAAKTYAIENRFSFDEDFEDNEIGRRNLECWAQIAEAETMRIILSCSLNGAGAKEWVWK